MSTPIFLKGKIIKGFQHARELGYKTANFSDKLCRTIPDND